MDDNEEVISRLKEGEVIIYPTDTIYGIGCNALNSESVKRIREIKKRDKKPFSVIAPGKDWIRENCVVDKKVEEWLKMLPGPFTLILKLRGGTERVCNEVNDGKESLGVRIPKHWIAELVGQLEIPVVTTSVNLSGEKYIESVDEISEEIKDKVDYIVDEGRIVGNPSRVVNLIGDKEKIIR